MNPEQILADYGITRPEDIDVEALAQAFGATVVYESLGGCEARIIGTGDQAYICVNPCDSRGRERFSAAHEFGHWLHDRGLVLACRMQDMVEWGLGREMRANRFAQNLLLPSSMFGPRAEGLPATLEAVRSLADEFETSLTATARKLVEYGAVPSILACYSSKGYVWHIKNALVPESFWLPKVPSSESVAAKLIEDRGWSGVASACPADIWIESQEASEYELIQDGIRVAPDRVIVLLSWGDDESQITDELDRQ